MILKFSGKNNEKIHVRRAIGEHVLNFKINEVTPQFLKEVFQLEKEPKFLISETTGDVTMIEESKLTGNTYYTINVMDVRNMPRTDSGI